VLVRLPGCAAFPAPSPARRFDINFEVQALVALVAGVLITLFSGVIASLIV
jgi:hypothetical protein